VSWRIGSSIDFASPTLRDAGVRRPAVSAVGRDRTTSQKDGRRSASRGECRSGQLLRGVAPRRSGALGGTESGRAGAGLRRERTRSTVDLAALLTTWADAGSGELEILISVEAKHRAKTSGLEKRGEPDVISGPGFRGRRLFHSTGSGAPASVAALLAEHAQDVRLVVVAHQGTRSLILSGKAQKTTFALERFAISPDALRVRELLLAGMPGGKLVEKRP